MRGRFPEDPLAVLREGFGLPLGNLFQGLQAHVAAESLHHVVNDDRPYLKHLREDEDGVHEFVELVARDDARILVVDFYLRDLYLFCLHLKSVYVVNICKGNEIFFVT